MKTEMGGALRSAIEHIVEKVVREQVRGIVEEIVLEMLTDPKVDQPARPARSAPTAQQREIARLYVEGNGYRQIEAMMNVHSQVILDALKLCLGEEERAAARAKIKGDGQRRAAAGRREAMTKRAAA